jgi:hypothetical protein
MSLIVGIVSLYAFWEMMLACHIFVASLLMNQDEDFEFVEKSDCEAAEEDIKDDYNSQLCLKAISLQMQKSKNGVEEEGLREILKRLLLPCMVFAIWLPLLKIISCITVRIILSGVWTLLSLIYNRAKALLCALKVCKRRLLDGENDSLAAIEFLEDCIFVDMEDTVPQDKAFLLDEEKRQLLSTIRLLFLPPVIQYVWLPLARYVSAKMYYKLKYEFAKCVRGIKK